MLSFLVTALADTLILEHCSCGVHRHIDADFADYNIKAWPSNFLIVTVLKYGFAGALPNSGLAYSRCDGAYSSFQGIY
jgi:hypothetical protein